MRDPYTFDRQLKKGEKGEKKLDNLFSNKFYICPVPIELQKKGIDRLFIRKKDTKIFKIEYKTDFLSCSTGNAFIETCSIFSNNKCNTKGWAYTSNADFILYYVVGEELIYIVPITNIKNNVDNWKKIYGEKSAPNHGYVTKGIPLPLNIFEKHSIKVLNFSH